MLMKPVSNIDRPMAPPSEFKVNTCDEGRGGYVSNIDR